MDAQILLPLLALIAMVAASGQCPLFNSADYVVQLDGSPKFIVTPNGSCWCQGMAVFKGGLGSSDSAVVVHGDLSIIGNIMGSTVDDLWANLAAQGHIIALQESVMERQQREIDQLRQEFISIVADFTARAAYVDGCCAGTSSTGTTSTGTSSTGTTSTCTTSTGTTSTGTTSTGTTSTGTTSTGTSSTGTSSTGTSSTGTTSTGTTSTGTTSTGTTSTSSTGTTSTGSAPTGAVFAWGHKYGQVGDGSSNTTLIPTAVSRPAGWFGKKVTLIAAGYSHSMALLSDGSVFA